MLRELFIPFTKVDDEKRLVYGIATTEALDGEGEVVDYEASKAAFKEWSDYFLKITKGDSQGNIREMHLPIAAGKAVSWEALDEEKAIGLTSMITDDAAWEKVKNKTYTGYSIGMRNMKIRVEKRGSATVPVVKKYRLAEVSIVDKSMNPETVFLSVKAEGIPAPPATPQALIFDPSFRDDGSLAAVSMWAEDHGFGGLTPEKVEGGKLRLTLRPTGGFKSDSFRTVMIGAGVQAVVGNLASGKEEPDETIQEALNLAAGIEKAGERAKAWMKEKLEAAQKGKVLQSGGIIPALRALESLQYAMESEYFPFYYSGETPTGQPTGDEELADLARLTGAARAVLEFIDSELRQQLSGAEALLAAKPPEEATLAEGGKVEKTTETPKEAPATETPATTPAGSETPSGAPGGDATSTKIETATLAKAIEEVGAKVEKNLRDAFDARFKALESKPGPIGNPVVVDKTLGPSGGLKAEAAGVIAELQKMADSEKDPGMRQKLLMTIAEKQVKFANFGTL